MAIILWAIFVLLAMVQYAPMCKELSKGQAIAVGIILIIFGPTLAAATVAEALLDCFLPEGWDKDDS